MNFNRVVSVLIDNGIPNDATFWLDDVDYRLPDKDWIFNTFFQAWEKFKNALEIKYQDGSMDCDNFAKLCAVYAQLLHSKTPEAGKTALALGMCVYRPNNSATISHAINVAIVAADQWIAVPVFFEPQTSSFVELTKEEKFSCAKIMF